MKTIRIDAPAGLDSLEIAQSLVGPSVLLKAEYTHTAAETWRHHRPMYELHMHEIEAYREMYARMVQAIKTYVEQHVIEGSLTKADRHMGGWVLITPDQADAIKRIIGDYHEAYIAGMISPSMLSREELDRLIRSNILSEDQRFVFQAHRDEKPIESRRSIEAAYTYGKKLSAAPSMHAQGVLQKLPYEVFGSQHPLPLTRSEVEAIHWMEHDGAEYVRALSRRVQTDMSTAITAAATTLTREDVQDAVASNVQQRDSWRKIVTDLGDASGDWTRDLGRIAATEKQSAMQQGQARELIKRHGDPDAVQVAKIPAPDACQHCVRLHLTAGPGSSPRIFKLSELVENGTNVGRKARDWLPTVGPVHPWCFPAGVMIETSEGWKPIERVQIGDLVRTHLDRFRAVQRLSQRVYRGDLVRISVGDEALEVTPNHPLLSDCGWLEAGRFEHGARILHIARDGGAVANSDANDLPTQQREQLRFARILRSFSIGQVPARIYFDRNKAIGETEIDVSPSDDEFWDALIAALREQIENGFFEGTRNTLRNGLRHLELLPKGSRFSADRAVRILSEALSIFRAALCGDDPLLVSGSADGAPVETTDDRSATCRKAFRDSLEAFAAFIESLHNIASDLGPSFTYHGAPVRSVERVPFDGCVYNFSVEEDESYCTRIGVVHNCACMLVHVPEGWAFKENGDLAPEMLTRSEQLERNLQKAAAADWYARPANYGDSVPMEGVSIRIADPSMRAAVEEVVSRTPPEIFTRHTGVTLITTDTDRETTPLESQDYAYWAGHEIRLMQTLPLEKVRRVVEHEIGHSLNVYLAKKLGSIAAVRKWHDELWAISNREGFVSTYAKREPIENAAEATRIYIYHRGLLLTQYPKTFSFLHAAYRGVL